MIQLYMFFLKDILLSSTTWKASNVVNILMQAS